MHAILHLQPDGFHPRPNEALKQRLHQTRGSGLLAHDHGPQLAMIPNKHNLFRTQHDGYEALRLSGLGALVDQNFLEAAGGEPGVAGADTGAADHIRRHEDFALSYALQAAEFLVVGR